MNLKPKTIQHLREISNIKGFCDRCHAKEKYRCCDKMFCDAVKRIADLHLNCNLPDPVNKEVPYMGPSGCILPPEHRPLCTLFFCDKAKDENGRRFRRKFDRIMDKIDQDQLIIEIRKSSICTKLPFGKISFTDKE